MRGIIRLGEVVWTQWDELRHAAAVIGTVLCLSVQRRSWPPRRRTVLAQQVLVTGVEPVGFVSGLAVFVGVSVVVQVVFWIGVAGQSQLLGPVLVTVVMRELGPVLANIVVIARSSSAMAAELGILKISGELRRLEVRGLDPLLDLVMPRVLGMGVATLALTILFVVVVFASGFVFEAWLGRGNRDIWFFASSVLHALRPQDMIVIFAKGILPALFSSATCCVGGLDLTGSIQDLPRATQRALTRSVAGLLLISATVSLLTYL